MFFRQFCIVRVALCDFLCVRHRNICVPEADGKSHVADGTSARQRPGALVPDLADRITTRGTWCVNAAKSKQHLTMFSAIKLPAELDQLPRAVLFFFPLLVRRDDGRGFGCCGAGETKVFAIGGHFVNGDVSRATRPPS